MVTRPGRASFRGGVLIEAGRVARVFRGEPDRVRRAVEEIDAGGDILAPGLLDLHTHGGAGGDFLTASPETLERIARFHFRSGVTGFLATLSTASAGRIASAADTIRSYYSRPTRAALFLGLHLEGPFLNPDRAGAQSRRYIRPPDPELLEELLRAAGKTARMMTFAPELEGAEELIPRLKAAGVIPSIGHSEGDYRATRRALRAGVSYAAHLFNAFPPLHHRAPGPLGAILESGRVDTEIIADGFHISPPVVRILFRLQPPERIILVSDSVSATGGSGPVGPPRRRGGVLAGGGRGLGECLWNAVRWTGLPLREVLKGATVNPARVLGIERGDIARGRPADLTLWTATGELKRTILKGRTVYRKR